MKQPETKQEQNSFLFQVEIMVNAETNGAALEQLLHVLNTGKFADYRVTSGIRLGQAIEAALARTKKSPPEKPDPSPSEKAKIAAALAKAKDAAAAAAKTQSPSLQNKTASSAASPSDELQKQIRRYIETNKLIRLNVNKGRGVKLSIPCRIIGYDAETQLLTVYHVDEKQVHSLQLFEIDDFIE